MAARPSSTATRVRSARRATSGVLFADATTLYFAIQLDGFRRLGYSKIGKRHRLQVVLAAVMASDGLPLGYRLYPGNTTDLATLFPALADIRNSRQPFRPLLADAGMPRTASAECFEYILTASMRKLPAELREQAIDLISHSPHSALLAHRIQ